MRPWAWQYTVLLYTASAYLLSLFLSQENEIKIERLDTFSHNFQTWDVEISFRVNSAPLVRAFAAFTKPLVYLDKFYNLVCLSMIVEQQMGTHLEGPLLNVRIRHTISCFPHRSSALPFQKPFHQRLEQAEFHYVMIICQSHFVHIYTWYCVTIFKKNIYIYIFICICCKGKVRDYPF